MEKNKTPASILKHNNDPYGGGRHISPSVVAITSTIEVNLVCGAIDGSYQVDLERSRQAQQGYILYSFTPEVPPGFLIVSVAVNPVYLLCYNPLVSRTHFRLTDQAGHLLDLRQEVLVSSFYERW